MKILTLNINSIRAHIESFMTILDKGEYDIIAVQELKCEDAAFPHSVFEAAGCNIKVYGQKSYNGVAIFSNYSIEDLVRGIPDFADPAARFIECVIDGRLRLVNVYMPNGESIDSAKFPYKIEWMKAFDAYICKWLDSEEPVVLCGDFNVAIKDCDVWNPKAYEGSSITAATARKIMQEWLDAGWTDEFRRFNPTGPGYTWYGYRGRDTIGKSQGLRLDYFLTNKMFDKMTKNCYVDLEPRLAEKSTDHAGLVLELK